MSNMSGPLGPGEEAKPASAALKALRVLPYQQRLDIIVEAVTTAPMENEKALHDCANKLSRYADRPI